MVPDDGVRIDASHARGLIVGDHATMHATFHVDGLRPPVPAELVDAIDRVAIAVRRQWSDEAAWRRLHDPYALPVRWEPADPALVASWTAIRRLAGSTAEVPDLIGGDLVDVLDRVPTGRLVVLGAPGSGKTGLLIQLVLDLLERRRSGEPVPVLLPLGAWDPQEEDLYHWIERGLVVDNPAFARRMRGSSRMSVARALLGAGLVLPVLDGLDEMPAPMMGAAVARINAALHPGQRLVVAARTDAYRTAVRPRVGPPVQLAGAAGVEVQPVDPRVVVDYLRESAGGPEAAGRWDRIVAAVDDDRAGPVASALVTPLMASLALTVYNPRPREDPSPVLRDPVELLDRSRFPTRADVERHLLDVYLAAAYRPRSDVPGSRTWPVDRAARWLVFLARDMDRRGGPDFAWWRLQGPLTLPVIGLVAAIVGALAFPEPGPGVGFLVANGMVVPLRRYLPARRRGLVHGLAGAATGGLSGALLAWAVPGPEPDVLFILPLAIAIILAVTAAGRFLACALAALAGTLAAAFYTALVPVGVGDLDRLLNGLGFGLAAALAAGVYNRRTPAYGFRWSPVGFGWGIVGGVVVGFVAWPETEPVRALIAGALAALASAVGGALFTVTSTDLTTAPSPRAVLRRDRATFVVCVGIAALGGVSFAFATAIGYGASAGLVTGTADFVVIALGLSFFQSTWGGYTLTRLWLACTGRLPFRLQAFLEDAHTNRGVLRQAGAVYQFRHIELQHRLARTRLPR